MPVLDRQEGGKRRHRHVAARVALCGGMRDHAFMRARNIRTKDYPDSARRRLGDAHAKAREAMGYKHRTTYAAAVSGIKSVRSIEMIERGEPGVGQTVLFAVGRFLPNWTEDTPRTILEGGKVPPTQAEQYSPPTDPEARHIWDVLEPLELSYDQRMALVDHALDVRHRRQGPQTATGA